MNPERIIKEQARNRLADTGWGKAIAALSLVICTYLFISSISGLLIGVFTKFSEDYYRYIMNNPQESILSLAAIFVTRFMSVVLLFLAAPVLTGTTRLAINTAQGISSPVSIIFDAFSSIKAYASSLMFWSKLLIRCLLWTILCFLPSAFFSSLFMADKQNALYLLYCFIYVILFAAGILAFIVLTSKCFLAPFIFAFNENLTAAECIRYSKQVMNKNRKNYYKLLLSFLPWMLSCLLAFPVLYVIPYFSVSCALSAKYMLSAE